MIRTTKNQFYMSAESNLSRITQERDRYLQQISTGKSFSRISESPVSATAVLTYRSEDVKISQMGRNMVQGNIHLGVASTTTDEIHSVVFDAKDVMTAWSEMTSWTGTYDKQLQQTMIQDITQYEDRLYGLANTVSSGGSIFAGYQRRESETYSKLSTTDFPPGAVYNGDGGNISIEIGAMQTLQLNVVGGGSTLDGREIEGLFRKDKVQDSDARDIFELFSQMLAGMKNNTNDGHIAATGYPVPELRELGSGELFFVAEDGSEIEILNTHAGGTDSSENIANNAWNINDTSGHGVTALLRVEVTGNSLPSFPADQTLAAGDLNINGVDIGPVNFIEVPPGDRAVSANAALSNIRALASAINRESNETGVWATYEPETVDVAPYNYNLVLTRTEADGQPITIDVTAAAYGQTGLGAFGGGTTDYYPGAAGDSLNSSSVINGHSHVYDSNNGTVTLVSAEGFTLREKGAGVLQATLGIAVNEGLDRSVSQSVLDRQVSQLDEYLTHITAESASIAARRNHIEANQESLDVRSNNLQDAIDNLESVDMEEAIMKYYMAQNYYEATLASTSRVIETSILNYLR
ncbi:MAG: hypothetical protein JXR80_08920 [Deltaproteobacteria bacterium]|nr:hypothetical protein [Deltaproteobacteria bacterium]